MSTLQIALILGGIGIMLMIVSVVLRRRQSVPEPVDEVVLLHEVTQELRRGGRTAAVRLYRRRTGAGLLAAAQVVDGIEKAGR
ncbi:hypothetical protein Val02_30380 [Virgisporangium aliadipatigenens]|uniref:Uncharacterized protein n=1 Tax=Virgisporangium aliadipatigenens TaxID=741659 RepID=A0A8J4DRB2_9ACTN|nr:hypothetical protein [Virgisporangium aliadipatigenens]GIJ46152.1 hypothetical protein Val02_30380 [Virgisporangium aliadipatigenens]